MAYIDWSLKACQFLAMAQPPFLLIVDNYDSFTFNLYQAFATLSKQADLEIRVLRNDKLSGLDFERNAPLGIVISPGPGTPQNAGASLELINKYSQSIPILGVCLGHQAIGQAFGASVRKAPYPMHGKTEQITTTSASILFRDIPSSLEVMRYHSLVLSKENWPEELRISAETHDGLVMALEHVAYPSFGIQFHPESFLTPYGERILWNFLSYVRDFQQSKNRYPESFAA